MRQPRKQKLNTIYIVKSSETSKVYIGQTWYGMQTRLCTHKRLAMKNSQGVSKLYNSMRKYGIDTFTIEKLDECDTQEKANELEDIKDEQIFKFKPIGAKTYSNSKSKKEKQWKVKFEIIELYPGKKKNIAISEIYFDGDGHENE